MESTRPARGAGSTQPAGQERERGEDAAREALVRALPHVVAEHGWNGASPARLARVAGIAPHEFWDHFRSPEDCFVEVYDQMIARVTRTAIRSVASQPLTIGADAWLTQLDAIMTGVLAFFSLEPELARTCLVEVLEAGPAARARREDALGQFASYVEGLRLTHGEPMPAVAAELIALGTTDLIYNRVARGEAERLPELLPELRRMWQASVDGQREAEPVA